MQYDLRTIFWMSSEVGLLAGCGMLFLRRMYGSSVSGLTPFAGGLLVGALGLFLVSLRDQVPDTWTYGVANFLVSTSMLLIFDGTRILHGLPSLWRVLVLWTVFNLSWSFLLGTGPDLYASRLAALSFNAAAACLLAGVTAISGARRDRRAVFSRLLGAMFIGYGLVNLLRAILAIAGVDLSPEDALHPSPLWATVVLAYSLFPVLAMVIVILLVNARIQSELERLARVDSLTGLLNRRSFFSAAESRLAALRRDGHEAAVVVLDLDHFKQINDHYGHLVGDRVLEVASARMNALVSVDGIIGRMGGEEFCAMFAVTSAEDARERAERLRAEISYAPIAHGSDRINLTCSVGYVMSGRTLTLEALIDAADRAVYLAKVSGRDRVELSDDTMPPTIFGAAA